MIRLCTLFLMSLILFSCSQEINSEHQTQEMTVESAELIASAETDSQIAQPFNIRAASNGFFVYDAGSNQIHRLNDTGEISNSFGKAGDGPGEFRFLPNFWVFEDTLLLYDFSNAKLLKYSSEGNFINERAVSAESFSRNLEAKSMSEFYSPTGGKDNRLVSYSNMNTGETFSFGEAVSAEADTDLDATKQAIARRQVPPAMKNRLLLASNSAGLFAFHQTSGLLQNYSHDGELNWEHQLDFPFMEDVFDQFIEANKIMNERGNIILLMYANHIESTPDGLAILLNTPNEDAPRIFMIDNNGSESSIISYTGFESKPNSFTISPNREGIYFTIYLEGEIYKSTLPF